MPTKNLERLLVAEYVDGLALDTVFTAKDYTMYVFGGYEREGMRFTDAITRLGSSEVKRRFRELRDPKFTETPYVIDTFREDTSLAVSELRLIQRGKLR
jgi:hypothetical protein